MLAVLLGVRYVQGEAVGIGLLAIPLTVAIVTPLLKRIARRTPGFDLLGMFYLGLALRFIGSYVRYSDPADSLLYHETGVDIARQLRSFDFDLQVRGSVPGTGSVRYFSGFVSVFTGSSFFAEFIVFTLIAFAGAVLFVRALAIAFPESKIERYGALVMVWPSLAFWPSSVGKESLITFGLGVCSYGAARLFTHRRGGITLLVVGTTAVLLIRPHMALIVVIAVGVAELFVRSTSGSVVLSASKLFAISILLVGGAIAATRTAEFLDLDRISAVDASTALQETQDQTAQGSSEYQAIRADTPWKYPLAVVTVLARPFLIEARGTTLMLTALEGTALLALLAVSWRRLIRLPHLALRQPYVAYAVSFVLVFCYAFSVVSNFGILARQRTQALPLLLVLVCLPLREEETTERPASASRSKPTWRSNVVGTTPG